MWKFVGVVKILYVCRVGASLENIFKDFKWSYIIQESERKLCW